jgi:hypothetical protein
VTLEAGFALSVILALCGFFYKLGRVSMQVDGLTTAQIKSDAEQAATVAKLANLHSDVRLIVSRVNDIRDAQKKGKVYMLDQREDS